MPRTSAEYPKRLYRLVEPCYAELEAADTAAFLRAALDRTRERFGEDCGIESCGLARREGTVWRAILGTDPELLECFDCLDAAERGMLLKNRIAFSAAPRAAAVWLLGARAEWLAVFGLSQPPDEGSALLLQMARLAVQQRALEMGWTGMLDRARAIQRSLLPDPLPDLPGFDLAARSESAEEVGGDVFDAIRLSPEALGLMIADASGHGLPAALEARDVVVGLRMGAARQLKIHATIERLNSILCASTLSSRFVSLVYGELDSSGSFDYVNAGHPAPIILAPAGTHRLPESGRVLGVSPDSVYRVGHAEIPPAGMLLLFTDGVAECPSPTGEEFGPERLVAIASALAGSSSTHVCSAVFDALVEHSAGLPLPDDASVLVAKRLP
ncbi:MAG: PP2C family protein-serine/threonine phosphatase [Thermoanaerobaculia bacterium]